MRTPTRSAIVLLAGRIARFDRAAWRAWTQLGLLAVLASLCTSGARADEDTPSSTTDTLTGVVHAAENREREPSSATFEIPPAPSRAKPRFALEVHASLARPLDNRSLCPRGVGCVLQSGGGIGVSLERRRPTGFGVFGAYDIWFLDTDSVYELGVQQVLRAGVRYTMPTEIVFHPVFDVSFGVMGYGDTFRVATVGGLADFFAGCEVELSATFGLRAGLGLRVFSHSSFRTERDSALRGQNGVFAEYLQFQVGLTVM
jgi:hypothetical protein